jgi:DNA mismatch repair protein MutL
MALESDRASWSRTFRAGQEVRGQESVSSSEPSPETLPLIPEREQVSLRRDWTGLPLQSGLPAEAAQTTTHSGVPGEPLGLAVGDKSELKSHLPQPTEPSSEISAPLLQPETRSQSGISGTPVGVAGKPETSTPGKEFKILGVLGKLYVLMENASGLVLVDQHAAHERILFEEMKRRMEQQGVPGQRLLLPLTLEVSPRDGDWLSRNLDVLQRAGIGLEPFGAGTFKIDSLPTFLRGTEPAQLLRDIIDDLRDTSTQTSRLRLGEDMIAKTVCRHAVKANDYLREPELVRLIQDLLACELPYCCPHGRPTMIQMSYGELEKKFGRKV